MVSRIELKMPPPPAADRHHAARQSLSRYRSSCAAVQNDMSARRTEYVQLLWSMTERINVLHPRNWSEAAEQLLDEYAGVVFAATKKRGWDGKYPVQPRRCTGRGRTAGLYAWRSD